MFKNINYIIIIVNYYFPNRKLYVYTLVITLSFFCVITAPENFKFVISSFCSTLFWEFQ